MRIFFKLIIINSLVQVVLSSQTVVEPVVAEPLTITYQHNICAKYNIYHFSPAIPCLGRASLIWERGVRGVITIGDATDDPEIGIYYLSKLLVRELPGRYKDFVLSGELKQASCIVNERLINLHTKFDKIIWSLIPTQAALDQYDAALRLRSQTSTGSSLSRYSSLLSVFLSAIGLMDVHQPMPDSLDDTSIAETPGLARPESRKLDTLDPELAEAIRSFLQRIIMQFIPR